MRNIVIVVGWLALVSGCMPLTPRVLVEVSPNGVVRYMSQQETDMRVGQIEFERQSDGSARFVAGTTTQPAFAYGSTAVGVIDANARLILAEVEMAKTVGPNIEQAMNGIAKAISAASWIGSTFGVSDASMGSLLAPLTEASEKVRAIQEAWRKYQEATSNCAGGQCNE